MKAIVIERYGGPEVLELREVPAPVAKDNGLLIRVFATVATPSDVAFRSADPFIVRLFAGLTRPRQPVLGDTLAGVVEAVGTLVTRFQPGDRVVGTSGSRFGCYAEFVAVPEDAAVIAIPAGIGFAEAAAMAEGYLTAISFIRDEAALRPGQAILINGASGSVGSSAVQLAKHYGGIVTGVCSTRNVELVRSLGADRVVDYTQEDFTAVAGGYDVIFDAVGKSSFARCKEALKPDGIYLTTVPGVGILLDMIWRAKSTGKRAKLATTGLRPESAKRADLALMNELIAAGALRPLIDRSYPLAAMAEAHRFVATERKRGSVVIEVG